jgi:hypothetical protein
MIDLRSAPHGNYGVWARRTGFVVWYALFMASAGLIIYGTLAGGAGVRDGERIVAVAGVCSVAAGIAVLNAITRRFPLSIRAMFVAIWVALALAIVFLE